MNITNQRDLPSGKNEFVISHAKLKVVSETISTESNTNLVFKSATYIESVLDSIEAETPLRRRYMAVASACLAPGMGCSHAGTVSLHGYGVCLGHRLKHKLDEAAMMTAFNVFLIL